MSHDWVKSLVAERKKREDAARRDQIAERERQEQFRSAATSLWERIREAVAGAVAAYNHEIAADVLRVSEKVSDDGRRVLRVEHSGPTPASLLVRMDMGARQIKCESDDANSPARRDPFAQEWPINSDGEKAWMGTYGNELQAPEELFAQAILSTWISAL